MFLSSYFEFYAGFSTCEFLKMSKNSKNISQGSSYLLIYEYIFGIIEVPV